MSEQEIRDAYKTVGIELRAKIEHLWKHKLLDDAKELQKAYDVINSYVDNVMEQENRQ